MEILFEESEICCRRWYCFDRSYDPKSSELHVYTGLFGSHVAFIMRRLRRLCAAVGNRRHLQFISCTATLPNAREVLIHVSVPTDLCST